MKIAVAVTGFVLALASAAWADNADWPPTRQEESVFTERKLETFKHGIKPEWGYTVPQTDTFLVLHPKQAHPSAPLYVVLHSAGHDVHSCLACTTTVGDHDIYHSPPDFLRSISIAAPIREIGGGAAINIRIRKSVRPTNG